jgi:3-mercaptopyruvate sulfurtransferase SseA
MVTFGPVSRPLLRDVLLYLIAALVLGAAANLVPGRQLAWWGKGMQPPTVGVDFQWIDAFAADALRTALPDTVFVDTRSAEQHEGRRVPGAVRLAYTDLAGELTPELEARLRGAGAVVIYGASQETDVEQLLAQELHRRGLSPPHVLVSGFEAWEASGLEVEGSTP